MSDYEIDKAVMHDWEEKFETRYPFKMPPTGMYNHYKNKKIFDSKLELTACFAVYMMVKHYKIDE